MEVIVGRQPSLNRNALHDQQTSTRLLINIITSTTVVIIVNQSPSHFRSDGPGPGPHCYMQVKQTVTRYTAKVSADGTGLERSKCVCYQIKRMIV